jgi:protein-S-isoprenylcysteine O-methyltransferase Ste14
MKLGPRGEGWFGAQLLLLVVYVVAPGLKSGWHPALRVLGALAGLPLLVTGAVFSGYGMKTLGSNVTPFPKPKEDSELVTEGIYACVRHPIYTGLIAGAVGLGLLSGSVPRTLLGIAMLPFFGAKSSREEEWLRERYPEYAEYEARVRKLIPGVW